MSEEARQDQLAPAGVDTRRVLIIAFGVLAFLGASMGFFALVFFAMVPTERTLPAVVFPQPRLQADRGADLQQLLDRQRNALSGYRWTSSDHSLVAIPVERAMAIIAQRGAKAYEPIEPVPASAPSTPGAKP
jgi:hypothetical protein